MSEDARIVRLRDVQPTAWLGGGGVTRELFRHPSSGDFDWRISIASVSESGPFSELPGIDRILTLCDGDGMSLEIDGAVHDLERWVPVSFTGEAAVSSTLHGGPTTDLNVMTRRGAFSAEVEIVEVSTSRELAAGSIAVVLDGFIEVSVIEASAIEDTGETLVAGDAVHALGDIRLHGAARLQVAQLARS